MSSHHLNHSNQFTNDINTESYLSQQQVPHNQQNFTLLHQNLIPNQNSIQGLQVQQQQSQQPQQQQTHPSNQQSNKRQNSQSYVMANNPSKRAYNNMSSNYINDSNLSSVHHEQIPVAKQSSNWVNQHFNQRNVQNPPNLLSTPPNLSSFPSSNQNITNSQNNSSNNLIHTNLQPMPNINKKILLSNQKHLIKTPTPSSYNNNEVPSSPNLNISQNHIKTYLDSDLNNSNSDSPDSNQSETPLPQHSVSRTSMEGSMQPILSNQTIQNQPLNTANTNLLANQANQRVISEEEQQLAKKLKETYKNIVRLEEICQKGCIELNNKLYAADSRPELSNELWKVYHNNISLLDNYYDFLLCALRPSSVRTGKQIVNVYKIPRRMWVYGIVGFLEVLKSVVNVFIEHEICACFIAHCFSIVSILTDSIFDMEGWWSEKLGDLSRMAIALYSTRFIDWKISSESWYQLSMQTQYGHGKIYYHMSTVQQDNLDALVNIGKSVTCRDPFVPTPQYLRLVVENICNQRNVLSQIELPIIDFIKIHKISLMLNYNENNDMISLVSRYSQNFGVDPSGLNFFNRSHRIRDSSSLSSEKLSFWFSKGSSFALSNIIHLIGFGDYKNPLARLFELPEALKERKDKKDKKRKSRGSEFNDDVSQHSIETANNLLSNEKSILNITAYEMMEGHWFESLEFMNKGIIELSMRMLKDYVNGPRSSSTGHLIVWLYFLVSIGEASTKYPTSSNFIEYFLGKFLPWDSLINYLNRLLITMSKDSKIFELYQHYNTSPEIINVHGNFLNFFSSNEFLPEVWKCWGTLWFDYISLKSDYSDIESAGIKKDFFDIAVSGTKFSNTDEPERIVRILLLAKYISDNYNFGLMRDECCFKFNIQSAKKIEIVESNYSNYFNEFLNDSRFMNLFEVISSANLSEPNFALTIHEKDDHWYKRYQSSPTSAVKKNKAATATDDLTIDESDLDNTGDMDSEFDDDESYIQSIQRPEFLSVAGDMGDQMDSAITFIVLDTNMWLKHCGRIYKCIRNNIFKSSIPLTVFQELRSLRRSPDAAISDAATRAVITIRILNTSNLISPLRYDGTEASSLNETTEFENNSNWRSTVDEAILNTVSQNDTMGRRKVRGFHMKKNLDNEIVTKIESFNFKYCVLVTDDRNMRLRSRTIGLTSYQSKWLFHEIGVISKGRCID